MRFTLIFLSAFMKISPGAALTKYDGLCRLVSVTEPMHIDKYAKEGDFERSRTIRQLQIDRISLHDFKSLAPLGLRLPALKTYKGSWLESADDVSSFWDLSSLRHLEVVSSIRPLGFFRKLELSQMTQLRTLKLTAGYYLLFHREIHEVVRELVRHLFLELQQLTIFSFDCDRYQSICPIGTVSYLGKTLRELMLSDQNREGTDPISVEDLEKLRLECPYLEQLQIDLPLFPRHSITRHPDRGNLEAKKALKLLTQFRSLKRLWLVTEFSLGHSYRDWKPTDGDIDYDDARVIMQRLHGFQLGAPFKSIAIEFWRNHHFPNRRRPEGRTIEEDFYYWGSFRMFFSHFQTDSTYYQLGSEKVENIL